MLHVLKYTKIEALDRFIKLSPITIKRRRFAMPTVKVGLQRQIVLPTEICVKVFARLTDAKGLQGIVIGDYLDIETQEDGKIVMTPKMLEEQVIDGIKDKEVFFEMVDELRERFRDLSDEQAQAMVDRAVAAAKSEELEEIKNKRKTL